MNKAELVQAVQKSLGKDTSKAQAERAVDAVIQGIKTRLKKGKAVQLVDFRTFEVASRKARMGINPKTGERIKIKAAKTVKFTAGKRSKAKARSKSEAKGSVEPGTDSIGPQIPLRP
jgi:DNA-binding protein HU-beta